MGATRSRLICHSLAAAAVSWEAGLEAFGLRPAKYVPVTLSGLRERVAAAGGVLDAGPLQPGGCRLRVWLPPDGGTR